MKSTDPESGVVLGPSRVLDGEPEGEPANTVRGLTSIAWVIRPSGKDVNLPLWSARLEGEPSLALGPRPPSQEVTLRIEPERLWTGLPKPAHIRNVFVQFSHSVFQRRNI